MVEGKLVSLVEDKLVLEDKQELEGMMEQQFQEDKGLLHKAEVLHLAGKADLQE